MTPRPQDARAGLTPRPQDDSRGGGAGAPPATPPPATRRREIVTFLILAFGIWPVVAVGVVGGYGFLVWMYQILTGPPGPPGT